jgi:hypothetical protein
MTTIWPFEGLPRSKINSAAVAHKIRATIISGLIFICPLDGKCSGWHESPPAFEHVPVRIVAHVNKSGM